MSDLISRQAAIDVIFSEPLYEPGMKKRSAEEVVPAIFEKVKVLPSAHPEPCEDAVSRQAVINIINKPVIIKAKEQIEALPSVQTEQRWIPCSERLPGDSKFVLMTIRRMNEHYNHEPFISVGYISWNQSAWWCAHEGDCKSNDVRVDAWMPLPEPYHEDKQDNSQKTRTQIFPVKKQTSDFYATFDLRNKKQFVKKEAKKCAATKEVI